MELQRKHWKRLFVELILEAVMLVAPVSLDFLGVAGEYLLEAGREKTEAVNFA
ncbi:MULTISPECIES: hypothetical protein [Trichocoleus]|uniref:Uncharacterized protein n=1 Tax=Trichocoleus desertorum GB2-A4 TaxID=2933944 RepID=A0ABV0J1Z1_9CYAN|nr:hypothetical protein [Trichocoleus sp. FACHB-46]MBD1860395.1 hypothetical protein [Trichocoleus sp. FACHB-46]